MTLEKVTEELGLTLGKSGKYRVLVFFKGDFSVRKKNWGIISLFLSGSPADAEGDMKVFACPNPRCNGVIDPVGPIGVCPSCRRTWPRRQLVGEMAYKATVDKWADHLARYVRALKMDCDIYLKRAKENRSIVEAEMAARQSTSAGEQLTKARHREEALYTAARIIEDVQTGQSLENAIRGFLLA
jgi:hypothetical protein